MEIIYKKTCIGKGRPSKFYRLDDGTEIHYKIYEKDHPEVLEQFARPKKVKIESDIEKDVPREENTYPAKTVYGTQLNIIKPLGDIKSGVDDLYVLVHPDSKRCYYCTVKAKDLIKPNYDLPKEFEGLIFHQEEEKNAFS